MRAIPEKAVSMLYEGESKIGSKGHLMEKYIQNTNAEKETTVIVNDRNSVHSISKVNRRLRKISCERWKNRVGQATISREPSKSKSISARSNSGRL